MRLPHFRFHVSFGQDIRKGSSYNCSLELLRPTGSFLALFLFLSFFMFSPAKYYENEANYRLKLSQGGYFHKRRNETYLYNTVHVTFLGFLLIRCEASHFAFRNVNVLKAIMNSLATLKMNASHEHLSRLLSYKCSD